MPEASNREAALAGLARSLGEAWLGCSRIAELGDTEIPKNRTEAYFVADRMARRIGEEISGWKVGATSARMRELDGHSDVIPGRIFRSVTWEGGEVTLPIERFPGARVEAEFAFRVTADVTPAEIDDPGRMAEIAVLHPAVEIIGNRFLAKDLDVEQNSLMTVADNGGGIGFVFGTPVEDWQGLDLLNHEVRVSVDGGAPSDNFLGARRGPPLQALCDLANHLTGRGFQLQAGDFVSTGAACVPQPVAKGSRVEADFGTLGTINVRFD
ncbi:MAG: hypothetical protein OXH76_18275 [Boseongicola sp.]|nr:hypothetical protein [Boseongicola sp.]